MNLQAIHIRVDTLPDVVETPDGAGGSTVTAGTTKVHRRPGSVAKLAERCRREAAELYALSDYLHAEAQNE